MESKTKTEHQKWIQRRVEAVNSVYSVFDALSDSGIELIDQGSDIQIQCPLPGHGPDNRPSGRYYGGTRGNFYCFKCKENLNTSVNVISALKGSKFMEVLVALERRFNIKIPKKPDEVVETDVAERGFDYESTKRMDVPTMLEMLEKKLRRIRNRCPLTDYVKFCRLMDAVHHDFERIGKSTPEMAAALSKLSGKINDVFILNSITEDINSD